jgi:acyl carrier protein
MVESQQIRLTVIDFLAQANSGYDVSRISDDTNLIEAGLLDSARFLELMILIEQVTGQEIDFMEVAPEAMMSIGGICAHVNRP